MTTSRLFTLSFAFAAFTFAFATVPAFAFPFAFLAHVVHCLGVVVRFRLRLLLPIHPLFCRPFFFSDAVDVHWLDASVCFRQPFGVCKV